MQLSFRQACIVSLTVHLLLLPGMGWLAGGWFRQEPVSQLIEIELSAGGSGAGGGSGMAAAAMPPRPDSPASSPAMPAAPAELVSETDDSIAAAPVTASAHVHRSQSAGSDLTGSAGGQGGYDQGGSGAVSGTGSGTGDGFGSGTGSGLGQSTILPPRVLQRYEPNYPQSARRANQEGVVRLRIEILASGLPGDITIASSSGYQALDDAAEAAVRRWRFVPARDSQSGAPVASVTVLPIAFLLR